MSLNPLHAAIAAFLYPNGLPPPFFNGGGPEFPDQELRSLDDDQVKTIMTRLGITEFFQNTPELTPTPVGAADVRGYIHKTHPTHWFFFIRWEHAPIEIDNGFALHGWRKSRYTREQFRDEVMLLMGHMYRPDSGAWTYEEREDEEENRS